MSDNNKDISEQHLQLLKKRLEEDGVAFVHVQDGYVCMFKRQFLLDVAAKHADQDSVIIFIKDSSKIN